jgi:RNA polymerase sigma factor (sigma-70 family)
MDYENDREIEGMTDRGIIQGLIARDNRVTKEFFFGSCRPLLLSIMKLVYNYEVDYDELVNELYVYLMEDDAEKLRNFQYRSSVYQWLKILSIRFFIKKRERMIEDKSKETPYDMKTTQCIVTENVSVEGDVKRLLSRMNNKRYVFVIQRLILEDWEPEQLAEEMGITTANLYNIKRRAMAQLTRVALNDIKEYGK